MRTDLDGDIELHAATNARVSDFRGFSTTLTDKSFSQTARTAPARGYKHLLQENDLGIVDNPLFYRSPNDLERDVRIFHENHRLANVVDVGLLIKGAQLSRDKEQFMRQDNEALTSIERKALQSEDNPRLSHQPKALKVVLLTCCIAAIVQGWSQANLTGANLSWPKEFGLFDNEKLGAGRDTWTFGAVNSATYFAASLVGGWLSDPLNEHVFGRRGALFIAATFSLASSIGSGYTKHSWDLFACRFIQGIGMGAKASIVPVFESEVCPPKIRGRFLVSWQTFTAFGIFLGSCANLIFHKDWRWQIASAFIPAVPLFFLVLVCSESPHWLVKHNKYEEAYKALLALRDTPLQAARDLYQLHCQLQVETILLGKGDVVHEIENWTRNANHNLYQQEMDRSNFFKRLVQLFTVQRNRRASLAACVVMAAQQLSGINIFAFLAATFIHFSDLPVMKSLWLSFGFGLSNAIFSPLAYFSIDTRGRRFLLLLSLILMVPLLIAAGFSLEINSDNPENSLRVGLFELFLILYTAAYSPGAGVVPFLYSSEVFPLVNREVGMSLSCSVNFLLAGLLALTVPQLQNALGPTKLLGLFAGLDAVAVILVWLFVPGTRRTVTLEEFNYIFGVPTRRHVQYQVGLVLPWIVRSYIPWLVTRYIPWIFQRYFLCSSGKAGPHPGEELPELDSLYTWNSVRKMDAESFSLELQTDL